MRASISFIIPVLNEEDLIGALLCDLRQRYPGSQLIVVDGGSCDHTVTAALPLCDLLLLSAPGRACQMNLGGQAASAAYLFFLHADTRPGVCKSELDACLVEQPAWGFCRVRLSGRRRVFRVIEWWMNQRSRLTSIATGDQMLFIQKALFEKTGGFDAVPLMEDVALCKRLRRTARPLIVSTPVQTSSRRWEEGGVVRTVCRMWLLRLAYFFGVPPGVLWRFYYGR